MSFLITTFIYPLAEPIALSDHFNYQFDNPRTEEEIAEVESYLLRACDSGEDYCLPVRSDEPVITVERVLLDFRESFADFEPFIQERYKLFDRETLLNFLARMWVVARYDDEGEELRLREAHKLKKEAGEAGFFMLGDNHPIIENSRGLSDFSHLLSLLIHSEGKDYYGRRFIIEEPEPTTVQDQSMWFQVLLLGIISKRREIDKREPIDESLRWVFLPHVLNDLQNTSYLLDQAFKEGSAEKLLYVGSLLRIVSQASEEKVRLFILTSIIELLLTHSPDYNRFNVEESISKQFRLKASILVYLNNRNRDINLTKNRLKTIYEQRSNIAHGNFGATGKYIRSLSNKEGEEEYFSDLISDLYAYTRAILEEYLKDKTFVEFLKDN